MKKLLTTLSFLVSLLVAQQGSAQIRDSGDTIRTIQSSSTTYVYASPFVECGAYNASYCLLGVILWSDQVPVLKDCGISLYANNYLIGFYDDLRGPTPFKAFSYGFNVGVNTTFSLYKK